MYTMDGQDVRIGAGLYGLYFAGQMNDLRIWSAAMSAGQIADDMGRVLSGGEADLAAGWSFDELAGDVVWDVSPFQRHAALGQPGRPALAAAQGPPTATAPRPRPPLTSPSPTSTTRRRSCSPSPTRPRRKTRRSPSPSPPTLSRTWTRGTR
jgi:hypothetical protein